MGTQTPNANIEAYTIGVDGGGSKTLAVVLDRQGRVLGQGSGGAANHYQVGIERVKDNILAAMQTAMQEAGLELTQIAAVTWALAGVGRPKEQQRFLDLGRALFPNIPFRVEHDALAALVGGAGSRQGVVLIAGTGMIAYGENGRGAQARAGGWGPLLDQGGGYRLGLEALRWVGQSEDEGYLATSLTASVLETLHMAKVSDLIGWLYDPGRQAADVAALAPLVLREAERGDIIATEIVVHTVEALAGAVDAVLLRLEVWEQPTPVVLAGSLLTQNDFYFQLVSQAIQTKSPFSRPRRPQAGAAVGAALLAFEALGYDLLKIAGRETVELSELSAVWSSEQMNVLTRTLDLQPALTITGLMHLQDQIAVAAIRPVLPAIARAIEDIVPLMARGGRLIYVGAGTSGRLGLLDAAECPPTFNSAPGQVIGLIAGGLRAMTDAVEGVEDQVEAGAADLAGLDVGPDDAVVGLAASGRTPYVRGALEEANRRGALTIALTCNLPAPVAQAARHVIAPVTGPEALTGSTRLKAGTVQKLVLNMLSTGIMIRLGKTYGNLMVDVQQTNSKLQARARRIVAQACGLSKPEAARLLAESWGEVKTAIVSHLAGCAPAEARQRLAQSGGVVRRAIIGN